MMIAPNLATELLLSKFKWTKDYAHGGPPAQVFNFARAMLETGDMIIEGAHFNILSLECNRQQL